MSKLRCLVLRTARGARFYVGIFKKQYAPRKRKIASGDHPASSGGNWPTAPMASNNRAIDQ